MAYSKTLIFGGSFQNAVGQPLGNGYLVAQLSHDSNVTLPASQVVAGARIRLTLDNNGNLNPNQYLWTDDLLNPTGSFYVFEAYSSAGLKVWTAPQYFTLVSGAPIDLGSLTPVNP